MLAAALAACASCVCVKCELLLGHSWRTLPVRALRLPLLLCREETRGRTYACLVWDGQQKRVVRRRSCMRAWSGPDRCNRKRDAWCREGVVAINRQEGPVLIPYSGARVRLGSCFGMHRLLVPLEGTFTRSVLPLSRAQHLGSSQTRQRTS